MNKKETDNSKKPTTPKSVKSVKIIVESVYVGSKSISEVFLDIIYKDISSKIA